MNQRDAVRQNVWQMQLLCLSGAGLLLAGCSTGTTARYDGPMLPANYPPTAAAASVAENNTQPQSANAFHAPAAHQSDSRTVTAMYAPPAPRRIASTPRAGGLSVAPAESAGPSLPASEKKASSESTNLLSRNAYSKGAVQQVSIQNLRLPETSGADTATDTDTNADHSFAEAVPGSPLPAAGEKPADTYPLDLPTAMQLAGANNWQIALAAERVREAAAQLHRAKVLWLPSIDVGLGYNRHDGQIQATEGEVIDVSRQSGFIGGGPRVGSAPLTGPSGGPPRLFVGLNPAEAWFAPLAARQVTRAADAGTAAAFNDTLLEVGLGYYDLVAAQMRTAIAREAVRNAGELVELTRNFVEAGAGLQADVARARAQLADFRVELYRAEQDLHVASAELARLLRLDPAVTLCPGEVFPLPVTLVPANAPLPELISQGLASRPELARQQLLAAAAETRWRQEKLRPWVPNLQVGTSAGGFGGGADDFFGDFNGRNDLDILAVWSVENLGLGNQARQREQASRQRQEVLEFQRIRDVVATEVTQAWHRAKLARRQIEEAADMVAAAAESLPLNFRGIRGGELRPIEAQQAIRQLADARQRYLAAVIDYDRAQLQLLRAIGTPPEHALAGPGPAGDPAPLAEGTDSGLPVPPPAPEPLGEASIQAPPPAVRFPGRS